MDPNGYITHSISTPPRVRDIYYNIGRYVGFFFFSRRRRRVNEISRFLIPAKYLHNAMIIRSRGDIIIVIIVRGRITPRINRGLLVINSNNIKTVSYIELYNIILCRYNILPSNVRRKLYIILYLLFSSFQHGKCRISINIGLVMFFLFLFFFFSYFFFPLRMILRIVIFRENQFRFKPNNSGFDVFRNYWISIDIILRRWHNFGSREPYNFYE